MDKLTFVKKISEKFVFMEKTAGALYVALTNRKNVLLWGPGGHAKSEVVEYGLELLISEITGGDFYRDVFVTCGSKDMDSAPFIGYEDIKKYQEEGVLERIVTETIYLKKRWAVIDEILDMPDYVMTSMKDPLQRGKLCISSGGICVNNTLENLFGCTNIDPYAWAGKDQSKLAMLQRFHFIIKVQWDRYDAVDFAAMYKSRVPSSPTVMHVAGLAGACHKQGLPISPRTAMLMLELYQAGGIDNIEHIHGITPEVFKKLVAMEKSLPYIKEIEKIQVQFDTMMSGTMDVEKVIMACVHIEAQIKAIKNIPTDSPYYEASGDMLKEVQRVRQLAGEQALAAQSQTQW